MLEIIHLRKVFEKVIAVKNLNLKVSKGEIYGLLGPNGAGKTTTIRCIMNIIKPDEGKILIDGKEIGIDDLNKFGYLPEERGLYSKSKVLDVVSYFGELKGMHTKDVRKKALNFMNKLDIGQYADRKVNELSKGNQQKVQLVTAILHQPDVIILDEPFSGLDPINQQLIKDLILELVNDGRMIILSFHNMDIAEKLCSKITLVNKGEEVLSGSIQEVKKKFGKTSIGIKYLSSPGDFKRFPEIEKFDLYENYAEVLLAKGEDPQNLLRKLVNEINITGFEIMEPSLHRIFIETVSATNNQEGVL